MAKPYKFDLNEIGQKTHDLDELDLHYFTVMAILAVAERLERLTELVDKFFYGQDEERKIKEFVAAQMSRAQQFAKHNELIAEQGTGNDEIKA